MQANLRRCRASRCGGPDTPAMALYAALLEKAIVVDCFHFEGHSETDTFCQEQTNPTLERVPVGLSGERTVELAALMEFENSESSEQFFRYAGRFEHVLGGMAISNATFYVHRMFWIHNERQIQEVCYPK